MAHTHTCFVWWWWWWWWCFVCNVFVSEPLFRKEVTGQLREKTIVFPELVFFSFLAKWFYSVEHQLRLNRKMPLIAWLDWPWRLIRPSNNETLSTSSFANWSCFHLHHLLHLAWLIVVANTPTSLTPEQHFFACFFLIWSTLLCHRLHLIHFKLTDGVF